MLIKSTLSNLFTVLCILIVIMGLISVVAVVIGIRPLVMISESMHPEVPKGSLVLLDTRSNVTDVAVGDNVAYVLGKVEAMHKVTGINPETGEVVVKPVAETDGKTVVTSDTYLGKEIMSIPAVGGWIRSVLNYRWVVIIAAIGMVVVGCIPRGKVDVTTAQGMVQQE